MTFIQRLLHGFQRGALHALSLSFSGDRCRWVYGEIERRERLSFKSIHASGGCELGLTPSDDALLTSVSLQQAMNSSLAQVPTMFARPAYVVISVPSKHAYLGEISANKDDRENLIRYQIQELMEAAAGSSEREAAFDWQVKSELSDAV